MEERSASSTPASSSTHSCEPSRTRYTVTQVTSHNRVERTDTTDGREVAEKRNLRALAVTQEAEAASGPRLVRRW